MELPSTVINMKIKNCNVCILELCKRCTREHGNGECFATFITDEDLATRAEVARIVGDIDYGLPVRQCTRCGRSKNHYYEVYVPSFLAVIAMLFAVVVLVT